MTNTQPWYCGFDQEVCSFENPKCEEADKIVCERQKGVFEKYIPKSSKEGVKARYKAGFYLSIIAILCFMIFWYRIQIWNALLFLFHLPVNLIVDFFKNQGIWQLYLGFPILEIFSGIAWGFIIYLAVSFFWLAFSDTIDPPKPIPLRRPYQIPSSGIVWTGDGHNEHYKYECGRCGRKSNDSPSLWCWLGLCSEPSYENYGNGNPPHND